MVMVSCQAHFQDVYWCPHNIHCVHTMSIMPINAVTEHLIFIHLCEFLLLHRHGKITAFLLLQYAWYITMELFDFTIVSAVLVLKFFLMLIVLNDLTTVLMFSMTCHIWGGGGARFCWRTLRLRGTVCEMKSSTFNRYNCQSGKAWWTYLVNVNYRHGRRFAHFTQEGRKMGEGILPPLFHVPRKRRHSTLVIFWWKVVKVACINMQLFPNQSVCLCLTFWR